VIFDVSTDRGIRSGNQSLTEIMYGLFLQSLGYAKDLDLSELEIALEEKGQLERFEAEYERLFKKEWSIEKGKVAFALSEASRVLHSLDPDTYPMADSWVKAVKNKADISPGKLAERANELMKRRRPGQALMFVVDEVGQFVSRDVQKMLDLQAVVQSLGVRGRGKHWIVVTSQEKLGELVSGLDDKKIELARLMDRFPLQVHLEPSDISEVTSRRVLSKNGPAQQVLGELFDQHRGRFTEHTRLTADHGPFWREAMDDFYQRKWEGEERDRELLAQITFAIETLGKIVWLSGPPVLPSKLGDAKSYLIGRKQRLERTLGIAPQGPAVEPLNTNAKTTSAP
jgi:hypothetical protein